ncbi:hypothetical protein ASE02_17865 [Phenylobacterium sp. Root700]|nr:hypothetical protein ASE02_17865 [Phenylobacterium sp. Root700]
MFGAAAHALISLENHHGMAAGAEPASRRQAGEASSHDDDIDAACRPCRGVLCAKGAQADCGPKSPPTREGYASGFTFPVVFIVRTTSHLFVLLWRGRQHIPYAYENDIPNNRAPSTSISYMYEVATRRERALAVGAARA